MPNLLKKKNNKEFTFEERIRQHLLLLSANDEFLVDIIGLGSSKSY